jgi:NADPH:quinone reductase
MTSAPAPTGLQLQSQLSENGILELHLAEIPTPTPKDDEVVVRVEAAPINPSDLGLLLAGADMATATNEGSGSGIKLRASVSPEMLRAMAARFGQALPVGNEGGGVVVAAGSSSAAQALLGRTVGILGGATYSQYRCLKVSQCLALPDGVTPQQGASCFVNPLTALGMTETMRLEGHSALVHTAAASNLGQMLNKLCIADGIALVNVVRKPEQEALLRGIGDKHVVDSNSPTFMADLISALTETKATIAFDAIGGGKLGSQILTAMEAAASANATEFSRYGSTTFKQLYIYGGLDRSPTELTRSFGFSWACGGWLLTPFLVKIGAGGAEALRQRVANEITTTFASSYSNTISLAQALDLATVKSYARMRTGEKFLIAPHV